MKNEKTNTKTIIMIVALGLLIVISGVQAIELVSLKSKLSNEITTLAVGNRETVSIKSSSTSLASSLDNLPSMVGGC